MNLQGEKTGEYQRMVEKLSKRKRWCKSARVNSEGGISLQNRAKKVLIVEDSQFNIMPIQAKLKRCKIPFDVANNGFMALERYSKAMENG